MADTDGLSAEQIEGISSVLDERGSTKQPLQTYEEMPDPAEQPEETTFGSDEDGLRKAAKELANRDELNRELTRTPEVPQESEKPITERAYIRNTGDGVERTDETKTVTAERAARDLTENRVAEIDQAEAALRQLAAQEIDATRIAMGNPVAPDPVAEALQKYQAVQPADPQATIQAQPESAPYAPNVSPKMAAVLNDPELRQELHQAIAQPFAQAETARQQYAAAIKETYNVAAHAALAHLPELQGLSSRAAAEVLKQMATQNPPRFQQAIGELQQVQTLHNQTLQFRQQEAQRQVIEWKTKWSEYVGKEDAKFDQAVPEMSDRETARKLGDISIATLRNVGFGDQDLKRAWNGEASLSLRDHRAQLLILKAARWDDAQRAMQHPTRPVPNVLRPGVAAQRGERDDVRLADLTNRLERTGNPRDAAALLTARRAARR